MWLIDKDYDVVTLDFESYYGTGCSLSLQKLNTYSYLAHPEFTIHGVGVKVNDGEFQWFSPPEMEMALHEIFEDGEKPVALVCHNTNFDGFILHHFWDLHPDLYTDTMGLSRGIFPNRKHSLEALAERLWPNDPSKRKGKELINFRNVTTETLYANPKALERMIKYCKQDIELTHDAFMMMEPHFPDSELEILHLTLQMTCEPLLRLDAPRVEKARKDWIEERENAITASGVTESTLSSNPKFKALLENKGVKIIEKLDPKTEKMKPALGKADLGFQQMKAANPELKAIFDGRVAAKSIGQISRAARFLETAEICGGLMPCPLIYYSALTGRYGGCLTGDTRITVYSHGESRTIPITEVADDDLVWDGTAFVTHGGVVFSGTKKVISHDGITGTPEHVVFTAAGTEKSLAEAHARNDNLKVAPSPGDNELAKAHARTNVRHP